MTTYYWHDYETFGTNPQTDRCCQFAGIRTDLDFNIVGDPLMLYCKVANDYLPNPEACLITGITPQLANEKGICEAEFIGVIHRELALPGTCGLGYNTIRFDDEVTRNLLYRNFYDPYAREWQNGNSRWDLIDVVRATYALRPEGIEWPRTPEGLPSFKLEALTAANAIGHQAAHDALSDVYATISLAKLIRERQPRIYDYLFQNRSKTAVLNILQPGSHVPVVHVSGRISSQKNCLAIVLPICAHPKNSNEIIVYDLSADPSAMLELDADAIQQRLFVANSELPEGTERIQLKTIHINKSPVVAPLSVIRQSDAQRLQLDLARCSAHLTLIEAADQQALQQKLAQVFTRSFSESPNDPDLMIYSGGFFGAHDKAAMNKIRNLPPDELAAYSATFDDSRLHEMLFRYRARNYPETLSASDRQVWRDFCRQRLLNDPTANNMVAFLQTIDSLSAQDGANREVLDQLLVHAADLQCFLDNGSS